MITVHIVLNAHLDPVWMWPWQAGLDEALATCRSACDRLDAHPDVIFSRNEAWIYQQVERVEPKLFERIRAHVKAGRWEIVGGWWLQPDCNLPSGFAMEKQIELGKQYFLDRFGVFPEVGYNVDSFGHSAALPQLMRAAGQKHYVMMRPVQHECPHAPPRLFRWRGFEGGPEVTTFRLAFPYCTKLDTGEEHIRAAIDGLPDGITHTMSFWGVGDHGGGPTERQIKWLKERVNAFPGCKLVFSSPSRFFRAIAGQISSLPLFTGELQMHAVGCYSVHRPVKLGVRQAEHLLRQAEIAHSHDPEPSPSIKADLNQAWERVCFNHFHDIHCGTSLPSAYPQAIDQLGQAKAIADEALHIAVRRRVRELPDDLLQRIVYFNASDQSFDGYVNCEPWMEWQGWDPNWRLIDEQGRSIPYQQVPSEGHIFMGLRLTFRISVKPGELRVIRVDKRPAKPAALKRTVRATASRIVNDQGFGISIGSAGKFLFDGTRLPLPQLHLIEDRSDTWSHNTDRYAQKPLEIAKWGKATIMDRGPLVASTLAHGKIGRSTLKAEYRVYAGEPFVELLLNVHWMERDRLLKLVWQTPGAIRYRHDGIMGGQLRRPSSGQESPLRDWTRLKLENGSEMGVVCPDVYACDATPRRLRLTLLRSPLLAFDQWDPTKGSSHIVRGTVADQGVHEFRFRFFAAKRVDERKLDQQALMLQRPLVMADLTRGMPADRPMERRKS